MPEKKTVKGIRSFNQSSNPIQIFHRAIISYDSFSSSTVKGECNPSINGRGLSIIHKLLGKFERTARENALSRLPIVDITCQKCTLRLIHLHDHFHHAQLTYSKLRVNCRYSACRIFNPRAPCACEFYHSVPMTLTRA